MHKLKRYKKLNNTTWLNITILEHPNSIMPKKRMNCYNVWYVYRVLICQIYVKGKLVANEIW